MESCRGTGQDHSHGDTTGKPSLHAAELRAQSTGTQVSYGAHRASKVPLEQKNL